MMVAGAVATVRRAARRKEAGRRGRRSARNSAAIDAERVLGDNGGGRDCAWALVARDVGRLHKLGGTEYKRGRSIDCL